MNPRFDGLYVQSGEGSARIIRFLPDGIVLTASVSLEGMPEDLPVEGIASWLLPGDPAMSQGRFSVSDGQLVFSSSAPEGTIEHRGTIEEQGGELHLHIHSLINGYQADGVWSFRPVASRSPSSTAGDRGLVDRYIGAGATILKAGTTTKLWPSGERACWARRSPRVSRCSRSRRHLCRSPS